MCFVHNLIINTLRLLSLSYAPPVNQLLSCLVYPLKNKHLFFCCDWITFHVLSLCPNWEGLKWKALSSSDMGQHFCVVGWTLIDHRASAVIFHFIYKSCCFSALFSNTVLALKQHLFINSEWHNQNTLWHWSTRVILSSASSDQVQVQWSVCEEGYEHYEPAENLCISALGKMCLFLESQAEISAYERNSWFRHISPPCVLPGISLQWIEYSFRFLKMWTGANCVHLQDLHSHESRDMGWGEGRRKW